MDAFASTPPEWTATAVHSVKFCCPQCNSNAAEAKNVWLNRRSPVTIASNRRKWQEFYLCQCDTVWWGWSSERPIRDSKTNHPPTN